MNIKSAVDKLLGLHLGQCHLGWYFVHFLNQIILWTSKVRRWQVGRERSEAGWQDRAWAEKATRLSGFASAPITATFNVMACSVDLCLQINGP